MRSLEIDKRQQSWNKRWKTNRTNSVYKRMSFQLNKYPSPWHSLIPVQPCSRREIVPDSWCAVALAFGWCRGAVVQKQVVLTASDPYAVSKRRWTLRHAVLVFQSVAGDGFIFHARQEINSSSAPQSNQSHFKHTFESWLYSMWESLEKAWSVV